MNDSPNVNSNVAVNVRYAGFWLRLFAGLIDSITLAVFGFFVSAATHQISGYSLAERFGPGWWMAVCLNLLIHWLYYTVAESSKDQGTPGKVLLGLKVTDEAGRRISFGKANARYWSKILSGVLLYIGYFMIGFTKRKQGLHDVIAHTLVLRKDANDTPRRPLLTGLVIGLIAVGGISEIMILASTLPHPHRITDQEMRAALGPKVFEQTDFPQGKIMDMTHNCLLKENRKGITSEKAMPMCVCLVQKWVERFTLLEFVTAGNAYWDPQRVPEAVAKKSAIDAECIKSTMQ